MKIIILLLLSQSIYAINAVVRVLEAPIYRSPSEESDILQNKRMGEIIHLHNTVLESKNFYKTLTRSGSDGYIRKDFVKVVFNDERDLTHNIHYKNDPTDYVLNEPLYKDYPFADKRTKKAAFDMFYGQGLMNHYSYNQDIEREEIGPSIGLNLYYMQRAEFNLEDRLYFGFKISGMTGKNQYSFSDNVFSEEIHNQFGIGPIIKYTAAKYENFEIDLNIAFGINYNRIIVSQRDFKKAPEEFEELIFTGYSITNRLGATLTHKNLFADKDIQIVHGPIISSSLPYKLSTSTQPEIARLWNSNEYSVGFQSMFSYVAGFTYRY